MGRPSSLAMPSPKPSPPPPSPPRPVSFAYDSPAPALAAHRPTPKRRSRATWTVILFLAAFLATVFVLAATLTTIHTPSLKNPAKLMAPSISSLNKASNPTSLLETNIHPQPPLHRQQPQHPYDLPRPPVEAADTDTSPESQHQSAALQEKEGEEAMEDWKLSEQPQAHPNHSDNLNDHIGDPVGPINQTLSSSSSSSLLASKPIPSETGLHPTPDLPHFCYIQPPVNWSDAEDHSYPFNARSICLTSSVCFQPSTHDRPSIFYPSASLSDTKCRNVTTNFDELDDTPFNCSEVQARVHCAHGRFVPPRTPECPLTQPMSSLSSKDLDDARWLDGIAFFVPAYPHMGNIFHFSFVAGAISHLVSYIPKFVRQWRGQDLNLPNPIPITLVFRGGLPATFGQWQTGMLNLIINHRLQPSGFRISFASLNESVIGDPDGTLQSTELTCAKSAVLLGTRSHINLWPFPVHSWPDMVGNLVPVESIIFRHAAYEAAGIKTLLPHIADVALTPPPLNIITELPPRVIGYSSRNFYPDPTKDNPYQQGTVRRFSDADEAWFVSMLKSVAQRNNMSYVKLQTTSDMDFADQVRLYANVGVVAGIHGANLMNTIFMRPYAGLVEVFASGTPLQCYIAGANSGLWYVGYDPVRRASGEESGCYPAHPTCWLLDHSRRVMIDSDEDRRKLTQHMEEAAQRINNLHDKFSHLGGIPMEYVSWKNEYRLMWEKASSKGAT